MNKYALAAIKAVELYKDSSIDTPKSAWEEATIEVFPHQKSSQKKGCPKNAFLGLCEEGLVRGKAHNSQIDVVLALWNNDLIVL